MKKTFCPIIFSVALIMLACSEDKSTTGISIEPNDSPESSFSTNDQVFIDSVFQAYDPIQFGEDSGNDPSDVSKPTTDYGLKQKETVYNHSSNNGSCSVFIDRNDNAVQKFKSIKPGINVSSETILLRENDKVNFLIDLLYASYSDWNNENLCETEIGSYLEKCNGDDCQKKIIESSCNSKQIVYIKKSQTTTLNDISQVMIKECEDFVSTLSEPEKQPGESCAMNENNEITCETTSK